MTAKERLREWVDGLDEEDAAEALALLEYEAASRHSLSPDEISEIEASRRAVREGRGYTTDEVMDYLRSRR